jgi:L-asparagine oxygenase
MQGVKIEQFYCDDKRPVEDVMNGIPTPSCFDDLGSDIYQNVDFRQIDRRLKVTSMRFGRVYGFAQEQNGTIIQNLFPIRSQETEQISSSSKTILEMHTETAFHPWRPDVLALLCIRGDPSAGTTYAELPDILDALPENIIDHLHQPEYETRLDKSFQSDTQADATIRTPVLFDGATSMTFDRILMRGLTPLAQASLDAFSSAIEQVKKTVFLATGQLLLINNRTVVHGRTPFIPRYDGTDRWLKRAMVSSRLPDCHDMTTGAEGLPVVTTRF